MNITGHIGTKSACTQILAYADDVAIMSRSKYSLTDIILNIEKEAKGRGALFSENKNGQTSSVYDCTVGDVEYVAAILLLS